MSVYVADCREAMAGMEPESVDAIVCDPPYGLSFMGKGWDHSVPGVEFWREALRMAKPGTHLVAFGGTRTYHRLVCAIEDAGWEIRDQLAWLFGSGFPKSRDIGKDFDKGLREVVGTQQAPGHAKANVEHGQQTRTHTTFPRYATDPVTDLARQWAGWGTALKPAHEPIVLARKPLIGTVATNVTAHGTGALNVDGCRIGTDEALGRRPRAIGSSTTFAQDAWTRNPDNHKGSDGNAAGRWPANVVLDEVAGAMLDEQSGVHRGGGFPAHRNTSGYGGRLDQGATPHGAIAMGDTGGASRFFYCAKASRSEREAGLREAGRDDGRNADQPSMNGGDGNPYNRGVDPRRNHHATVKPVALMRWLCRLVTPPGGLILDPFAGSGTTGVAATLEGFRFIGCEIDPDYAAIAEARIAHARLTMQPDLFAQGTVIP